MCWTLANYRVNNTHKFFLLFIFPCPRGERGNMRIVTPFFFFFLWYFIAYNIILREGEAKETEEMDVFGLRWKNKNKKKTYCKHLFLCHAFDRVHTWQRISVKIRKKKLFCGESQKKIVSLPIDVISKYCCYCFLLGYRETRTSASYSAYADCPNDNVVWSWTSWVY